VQVVAMANARAAGGQGKEAGGKGEVAKLVGQGRRLLGVTAMKAQAKLLLERLQLVGQKAATPQEQVAAAAQEWQRRELEAADRALQEGMRGVHRGGQGCLIGHLQPPRCPAEKGIFESRMQCGCHRLSYLDLSCYLAIWLS